MNYKIFQISMSTFTVISFSVNAFSAIAAIKDPMKIIQTEGKLRGITFNTGRHTLAIGALSMQKELTKGWWYNPAKVKLPTLERMTEQEKSLLFDSTKTYLQSLLPDFNPTVHEYYLEKIIPEILRGYQFMRLLDPNCTLMDLVTFYFHSKQEVSVLTVEDLTGGFNLIDNPAFGRIVNLKAVPFNDIFIGNKSTDSLEYTLKVIEYTGPEPEVIKSYDSRFGYDLGTLYEFETKTALLIYFADKVMRQRSALGYTLDGAKGTVKFSTRQSP